VGIWGGYGIGVKIRNGPNTILERTTVGVCAVNSGAVASAFRC
jgi:hypothetical protein